jgi:protein-tyrosine phosphatase
VGKDRVGIATVLLLTALDIPEEIIVGDYLATNKFMQENTQELLSAFASYNLGDGLRESIQVLNSADTRFLQSAISAVESQYGSLSAYMREALDVTPEKVGALRAKYLVDA